MRDLISRQAAIDAVKWSESVLSIRDEIERLPTVEAGPVKQGRWERHYSRPNVYADLYWHCSACGGKNSNEYANMYYKFCPYCGARMETEVE